MCVRAFFFINIAEPRMAFHSLVGHQLFMRALCFTIYFLRTPRTRNQMAEGKTNDGKHTLAVRRVLYLNEKEINKQVLMMMMMLSAILGNCIFAIRF